MLACCLPGGQPHVVQCADCFWLWTPSLFQAVLSRTAKLIFFNMQDTIQSNITERASWAPSLRKEMRALPDWCPVGNWWPDGLCQIGGKSGARRDLRNHLLVSLKAKFGDSRHLLGPIGPPCGKEGSRARSRLQAQRASYCPRRCPGGVHHLLCRMLAKCCPGVFKKAGLSWVMILWLRLFEKL